jgi:hypothetical protein
LLQNTFRTQQLNAKLGFLITSEVCFCESKSLLNANTHVLYLFFETDIFKRVIQDSARLTLKYLFTKETRTKICNELEIVCENQTKASTKEWMRMTKGAIFDYVEKERVRGRPKQLWVAELPLLLR